MFELTGFRRYLLLRTVYIVITLWAVSVIIFATTQLLPGDAAKMILGEHATENALDALREDLGLYDPWYIQYWEWISGLLVGDLGESYQFRQPIAGLVWSRFINSVHLALFTMVFVIALSIPLGTLAAVYHDTELDTVISGGGYVALSIPTFVIGIFLLMVFAGPYLDIFPNRGSASLLDDGFIEWVRHLLLPGLSLGFMVTAHVMRQVRSSMIEALQSEYVRTARLKGLSRYKQVVKHALRNGLLPAITVIALNLGFLMGGIVVIEEVFAYPGIGRLLVQAIHSRDLPVIQITVLIIAGTYTLANFAADIVYTYLDPRISYGGG